MEHHLGNLGELTTSVVSMNFNGRFKPDEAKPLGKAVIQSLLGGTSVQLLFGQQASFAPSSQLPHGFRLIGGEASFIAYDSRLLSPCEPGWQYRRRVHDLTCNNTSKLNIESSDYGRLRGLSTLNYVACRFRSKDLGIRFIALSWFTDEAVKGKRQRQLVMHKVLSFARGLVEIEQLPLILAGSFHLSSSDARPVLENSNFRGIHCSGYLANSMRRELRASNLFFCSSPPVELISVRPRLLRGLVKIGCGSRETLRNPEDAFYHDPVFASMKLLVSIVDTRIERKTLELNERLSFISNCQQGLDSVGTGHNRGNRQVAGDTARITSDNLKKSALPYSDVTGIVMNQKTQELNSSLNDACNELPMQESRLGEAEHIKVLTSQRKQHSNLTSASSLSQNDKTHFQNFKRAVKPGHTESRDTVAGYCIKRSQRGQKQVDLLRGSLNWCDVIRGSCSSPERDPTIDKNEDDDDLRRTTTEMLINTARRLSTIIERGESSCSEFSAGSEAESLDVVSDDYDTFSEIESIGNAVESEQKNNIIAFELQKDFFHSSIIITNDNFTVDPAADSDDKACYEIINIKNDLPGEAEEYGGTMYTNNDLACEQEGSEINKNLNGHKQSASLEYSELQITSECREITGTEYRDQHLALQSSISVDSEDHDHSYVEHCQTCVNDWRSTFVPVTTMNDDELIGEEERFVEGATDSDDSDTYLLAENDVDSECEENQTITSESESMQPLLDSAVSAEKVLKTIRVEKNAACMLQ